MIRSKIQVVAIVMTALVCSGVQAQVMVSPKLKKAQPAEQPKPKLLTLHAMDQPDPMLRYRLWPAAEHRLNQNPAPLVTRALLLLLQVNPEAQKEFDERNRDWAEMPIADLPRDDVRALLGHFDSALNELKRAENLMQVDYNFQLDQRSAPEMIRTWLPELQEMRQLGRLLTMRARLAIAEKRWEDAIADCRLGFRLSEVAGFSTDFLVGRLVGFAISSLMMGVIEEAIQQPECPNLYWALASLPEIRLFETRDSLEFESVLMSRVFDSVGPLPDNPIGEVAAREKIRMLTQEASSVLLGGGDRSATEINAQLTAGMYVVTLAEPSRELLASTPEWGERASELSPSEAVLRASRLRHARIRDRWVAWSMLPPELWDEYEPEREAAFGAGLVKSTDVLENLVHSLMPAVNAARHAGRRTNQQRNFLITVEAIRMHAAKQHALPATLEKMRPVPAWSDSISAKPFAYHRTSATRATLNRAARWHDDPETSIHIELKGNQ